MVSCDVQHTGSDFSVLGTTCNSEQSIVDMEPLSSNRTGVDDVVVDEVVDGVDGRNQAIRRRASRRTRRVDARRSQVEAVESMRYMSAIGIDVLLVQCVRWNIQSLQCAA